MPQTAAPAPHPNAQDFAGLLSSLTKKPPGKETSAAAWNDSELADDIATLSYEQALRTHARHRPAVPDAEPLLPSEIDLSPFRLRPVELPPAPVPKQAASVPATFGRSLKSSSITIRLSEAESAQLHRRAAEAGLTVSAYLRSCTLEVETLRAQVKETLAQLRSPGAATPLKAQLATVSTSPRSWWRRLWPASHLPRLLQ